MPDFCLKNLVIAAQKGDKAAFSQIVTRTANLVTGIAYSVCGDFARSEDIGQEAFLEAWKGLGRLQDPARFSSWICTIARRRAIDEVRRKSKHLTSELIAEPHELSQPSPEAIMERKQQRELVWAMLEQLPETYRETMVLFYRSEQSVSEVAMALGENQTTIRQRLKRGRELIREEMTDLVSETIRSTVPKAAFAAAVMAALPKTAFAAGAAASASAATKGAASASGATALGAAAGGSLFGLGGAFLGTWLSWRNAHYKSEQNFMLRQTIRYGVGLVLFVLALFSLVGIKRYGWVSASTYSITYWILMTVGFIANLSWILFFILKGRKVRSEAISSGEGMRPEIKNSYNEFVDQARVTREDGSVGYGVFRWNAGAWFGASLGGLAWMLPTAFVFYASQCNSAAAITIACCVIGTVTSCILWTMRSRLAPLTGNLILIAVICILAAVVLAAIQWLGNEQAQTALSWHPVCWVVLLIFPAVAYRLYRIQHGSEKKLIQEDQLRRK